MTTRALFAVALLSCKGQDNAPEDDTMETASRGGPAFPAPTCKLTRPHALLSASDAAELAPEPGPDDIDMAAFRSLVSMFAENEAVRCPTEATTGDRSSFQGECAYEASKGHGWRYSGRWDTFGTTTPRTDVLLDVDFEDTVTGSGDGQSLRAAGTLTLVGGTLVRDLSFEATGWTGVEDGSWTLSSMEQYWSDGSYRREGHYSRLTEDGTTADWCTVVDAAPAEGCTSEPIGGWAVQGAATVVVVYDPDVACDGCGAVWIDGVAQEQLCGGYVPPTLGAR